MTLKAKFLYRKKLPLKEVYEKLWCVMSHSYRWKYFEVFINISLIHSHLEKEIGFTNAEVSGKWF